MDSLVEIFLNRAENELLVAERLFQLSIDAESKKFMKIPENFTFYSSVISHSYYAVFYSAKSSISEF